MESRTKLFGHPVHPMLIVFPLGLLGTAVIFDIIRMVTGNPYWSEIAFWMIAAGILSGLIAAPFGAIDWLAIPSGTRASRIGFLHGFGNVVVLMLFALSWWMRWDAPGLPSTLALAISFIAFVSALVTGWLGGELVDRLGVGVDDGANRRRAELIDESPRHSRVSHAGTDSSRHLRFSGSAARYTSSVSRRPNR